MRRRGLGAITSAVVACLAVAGLSACDTAGGEPHRKVTWYLDGEGYGTVTRDEVEAEGDWAFDRPFYLILNLAIGGVLGGEVPDTLGCPQELVIDWVRVYA